MEMLIPFANTGDVSDFSVNTDPTGAVSIEKGFTELYELRPEEGGLYIIRRVFNQMMKLVSTDTVTWKIQSFPNWIADKGDGLPYSYKKNVIVRATNDENYVSLENSNTDNPIGSAKWINLKDFGKENISITGSATFSGTTQNINLTNIGNITLAIGDVIQVSGTVNNNKLFTVESITDSNNIIVNYEHRGTSTPAPKGRLINETATNCTVKLYNRAKTAPIGQGQYWCRPASSRGFGISYINNINRPLAFSSPVGSGSGIVSLSVDDKVVNYSMVEPSRTAGGLSIAPPESSYKAVIVLGTPTFDWLELR